MKKQREQQAGFTLVEILVVLVIISVLTGIVAVNIIKKPAEARIEAARLQIRNFQSGLKLYRIENSRYPTQNQGLDALVYQPVQEPVPANYPDDGYLETTRLPLDPWKNPYIYLVPGSRGEKYEIISYGADGEPGGEDADQDISSSAL